MVHLTPRRACILNHYGQNQNIPNLKKENNPTRMLPTTVDVQPCTFGYTYTDNCITSSTTNVLRLSRFLLYQVLESNQLIHRVLPWQLLCLHHFSSATLLSSAVTSGRRWFGVQCTPIVQLDKPVSAYASLTSRADTAYMFPTSRCLWSG